MANMTTSIVMQLVDRVTSPVRRITQSLRSIAARAGMSRLGQQAQRVGAQMARVGREAQALGKRVAIFGGLAAAGAWGVSRLVGTVADAGNAIKQYSERLGVGSTWLQEWIYIGRQFGVESEAMADGFKELGLRADEFVMTAGGPAAAAFKRLGIDHKDLQKTKGNTEALFDLVLSKLRGVSNFAARQSLMDQIFGGQGGEQMAQLVSASAKEIERLRKSAHAVGDILTPEQVEQSRAYTRQMGDFGRMLSGIQRTVVGSLLPAITQWLARLREWIDANRALIATRVEAWLKTVWGAAKRLGEGVLFVADVVGGFGNLMMWIAGVIAGRFILSVLLATASLAKLGWIAAGKAASGLVWLARGVGVLTKGLFAFVARAIPAVIAGIRAVSVAFLTTPIGWIVGGIALVAGAAYLIYKNWDGVSAWFSAMWERIKAFFSQGPVEVAKQLLAFSPAGLIYTHWDGITQWASGLWSDVKKVFSDGIDGVFGVFEVKSLVDTGTKWVGGLWDGIKSRWDQLTAWLRNKVDELTGWMPDWARDKLGLGSMQMPQASGSPEARLGAPVASANTPVAAAVAQRSRVDVGGRLKIQVDSEGRARVKEARSSGGLGFDVDSGVLGVAG